MAEKQQKSNTTGKGTEGNRFGLIGLGVVPFQHIAEGGNKKMPIHSL